MVQFQSTRPVWGATRARHFRIRGGNVSIHAPRVGRDRLPGNIATDDLPFQSTRPVWGATFPVEQATTKSRFQSTRPVWGATSVKVAICEMD